MTQIKRETWVKKCDYCSETETVCVGIPREHQIYTEICECGKCGRHVCADHSRHIEIMFTGFGSYGKLNINLCATCEANLKKDWEATLVEYGVAQEKTPF